MFERFTFWRALKTELWTTNCLMMPGPLNTEFNNISKETWTFCSTHICLDFHHGCTLKSLNLLNVWIFGHIFLCFLSSYVRLQTLAGCYVWLATNRLSS